MIINKKEGIILLLIALAGAFLRLYHIDGTSFWNDELLTIQFVNHSIPGMFGVIWPKEMNMALYYLLCNFWLHLFVYPSEGTLRMLSVIFSVLGIPAVYFLGTTISDDKKVANATGLIAALLITVNAFNIQYAQDLRSYSLLILLSTVSTLLFIKAIRNPNSWKTWTAFTLVSIAGIYSHYFFILLLFAQAVSLAVIGIEDPRKIPWKQLIVSYVILAVSAIPQFIAASIAGPGGLSFLGKPGLPSLIGLFILIAGTNYKWVIFYVLAVLSGFFVGRIWSKKEIAKDWVVVLFASCSFLPACLAWIESELHTPLFDARYFIFSQPFLAIIAAFGIVKLLRMQSHIVRFCGALLLVLVVIFSIIGVQNYFTSYKNEDWRGVAQFLGAECSGENELRLYYPVYTQDFTSFYNPRLETQDPGLENELENPDQGIIANLIPTNYSKICLVVRPAYVQPAVVMSALQAKYPNMIPAPSFSLLEVYVYEK
jgi:4-amino-4-deoxy-L-arabinose transferase-like glycosyltransferase